MVAIIAEPLEERFVSEQLAEVFPFPNALPLDRGLDCWLHGEDGSVRGHALDVSKAGARVCGVGRERQEGERLLCKLELGDKEPPLVVLCKIVHVAEDEVGVRFLELGFDAWYRLGRFAAGGRAPARPSNVLMPPA